MKHCTKCQHLFPDQLQVCPTDNSPLRLARELEPGMIIRGKYIIQEWIGSGGMAAVYRARHRLLNEMRAVKVVSAKFANDEDFLWRFRHEAAIARKLRHENAVWVEDLDEIEDGRPFIAMEFLQGGDLRKLIKEQGPLAVERTLKLGAQVASALSAAHKLGIIHRDIKPDNIFIARDAAGNELAKVLDFGIAKAKEGVLQGAATATKTGVIIGTPEYMSPEQAEGQLGEKLDGRSDLYSLGVVLYEMLTGQLPFESDTPLGMCLHHLQTPPRPPHELRPDLHIPEAVSAVLMKALEKRREQRFQSVDEMLSALRDPAQWQNGSVAFAPTKVMGPQAAAMTDAQATVAPGPALGRVAPVAPAPKPVANAPGATASPSEAAPGPSSASAKASLPAVPPDKGRRWRIAIVSLAVAVCAIAGYFIVKATERSNAAMREHDSVLHDLVVEQLRPPNYSKLTVAVNSGTVTLSGTVSTEADKESAANLARSVNGVSDVINNVVVQGPAVPTLSPPTIPSLSPSQVGTVGDQPQGPPHAKHQPRPPNASASAADAASKSRVAVLIKLANDELDQGNYVVAIKEFEMAAKADPNNAAARNGLQRARKAQKAEEEVRRRRQQP